MPFRFTLQDVLDHRVAIEETRQREYALARAALTGLRTDRQRYAENIEQSRKAIEEAMRSGAATTHLGLFGNCIAWAEADISDVERRMLEAEAGIEARRLALAEAAKARMVLEKLREAEEDEYRKETDRAEQKTYDDCALREFAARKREEKAAGQEERIAS